MSYVPRLKRIRVLAAKVEATPGTQIALTDTDATFKAFNVVCNPETEIEERPALGGFGHDPAVPGARKGRLRFSSYLFGNSAAPVWAATLLPGVGLGNNGSAYVLTNLAPEASGSPAECLTMAVYQNGKKKCIYGAMGNMRLTLPSGKLAVAEFDFQGKWAAPIDATILAPTYLTLGPLRVVSSLFAIGAYTLKCATVSLDLGNVVHLREDSTDATGYFNAVISNRRVTGSFDPESPLIADADLFGDWAASMERNFTIKCISGSDSLIITATKFQIQRMDEGDREGVEVENVNFALNAEDLTFTFA